MTTTDEDIHGDVHPGRQQPSVLLALAVTVPGVVLRLTDGHC